MWRRSFLRQACVPIFAMHHFGWIDVATVDDALALAKLFTGGGGEIIQLLSSTFRRRRGLVTTLTRLLAMYEYECDDHVRHNRVG